MIQPMETAILQGVGNVFFHSGWEITNLRIGETGIVEFADVETELRSHRLDASNPELHVRISDVRLIVAAIADKEIENRQVPDTDPSVGCFISI